MLSSYSLAHIYAAVQTVTTSQGDDQKRESLYDLLPYQNKKYGFQYFYPQSAEVGQYDPRTGIFKKASGYEDEIVITNPENSLYQDAMFIQILSLDDDSPTLENFANEIYQKQLQQSSTEVIGQLSPIEGISLDAVFDIQPDSSVFKYTVHTEALTTFQWSGPASGTFKAYFFDKNGARYSLFYQDSYRGKDSAGYNITNLEFFE